MKKILALIVVVAMMSVLLVGCGSSSSGSPSSGSSAPVSDGSTGTPAEETPGSDAQEEEGPAGTADTSLTVGVLTSTDGFDPVSSTNYLGCNLVYETLFDIDPETSEAVGILAESWEYQDDTHLYIKLYDDAAFSNGDPVTGEDVYWSWYRNVEENGSGMNNFEFIDWENWEFISDKEFVISFEDVFGPAINYMTMCFFSIVDKNAMEHATSDDYWSAPVGSGPYTVVENVSGAYSAYTRNPNYWNADTMPQATDITVRNYSDSSTMFIDFETGALDIAFDLEETDAARVQAGSVDNATLELISTNNVISLAFPEYTEALDNVLVREALAYALDVEALTEMSYGILGSVATSFVPSTLQDVLQVDVQEYNPDKARELLAEAGISAGDLSLTTVIVSDAASDRLATGIQAYLADVGVNLEIESCDRATAISHFMNSETDVVIDSGSVVTMDIYEALEMTLSTSTNTTIRITDEDYNANLLAAKTTADEDAQSAGYIAAQQWLKDNYRKVPIVEPEFAIVYAADKIASVNTMCDEAITLRYVEFL